MDQNPYDKEKKDGERVLPSNPSFVLSDAALEQPLQALTVKTRLSARQPQIEVNHILFPGMSKGQTAATFPLAFTNCARFHGFQWFPSFFASPPPRDFHSESVLASVPRA